MKKIQALALLPIIALASCGKNEEVKVETTQSWVTTEDTSVKVETTQSGVTAEVATVEEEGTGETLNSWIIAVPVVTEQPFEFTYKLGAQVVPVKWTIGIAEGKILSLVVDGVKPTDKWPLVEFAKNAPLAVIWKEVKGLKIDSISGASLTTAWFNQYLSTLK